MEMNSYLDNAEKKDNITKSNMKKNRIFNFY